MRHASKGPDKSTSTCKDCAETFTHRKYSHPTYCEDCREKRENPENLTTNLGMQVCPETQTLTLIVTLKNNNDVPIRKVKLDSPDQLTNATRVVGTVTLEGDNGFHATNVWIRQQNYFTIKFSANSSKTAVFTWEHNQLDQTSEPQGRKSELIGREYREVAKESTGTPFEATEIKATFDPAQAAVELDEATTVVSGDSLSPDVKK